jgi:hypothetical protein
MNNDDNVIYVDFSKSPTEEEDLFIDDSTWLTDLYIKQENQRKKSRFLVGSSILTLVLLGGALLIMRA